MKDLVFTCQSGLQLSAGQVWLQKDACLLIAAGLLDHSSNLAIDCLHGCLVLLIQACIVLLKLHHTKDNLCHVHEHAGISLSKPQSCNLSLAFVALVEKLPPPGWSDDSGMTAGHCEEPDPALPVQT